ncbi:hypothetical protein ACFL0Z_03215 [Patescibacteria group bacterium]
MENQTSPVNTPPPAPKNKVSLWVFIVSGIGLLLIGLAIGYFWLGQTTEPTTERPTTRPTTTTTAPPTPTATTTPTPTPTITPSVTATKSSVEVNWNSPEEIASLDLFDDYGQFRGENAIYYKVGEVTSGNFKNGEVILLSAPYEGPAFFSAFYRFIKTEDSLFFLEKYSDELYDQDGLDRSKFTVDTDLTITALDFPDILEGPGARQNLQADPGVNVLFDLNNIKKSFRDPAIGDVYTTANFSDNYTNVFDRFGFYVQAADGTTRVYSLDVDFVGEDNVPTITWDDGTSNSIEYVYTDTTGCGSSNYISVVDQYITDRDNELEQIGTNSQGDTIYALKNKDNFLLKQMYDDEYMAPEGEKVSYEEFLDDRPMFFWVDPFDRLIKFKNATFTPAAECGKPVIYLYPEKTINVSVQVEPKGGFSYTEPEYGTGWKIIADSKSNLLDLASKRTYPYLFWEGEGAIYSQPEKGFVVAQSDVHSFLIEKLKLHGLDNEEIADFIEFWEPRMQDAPYYFVTFLGNAAMDRLAPLTIDPQPDTVIRVLMDFSPLDQPIDVTGYEIRTPQRQGFTVVEWGGVIRK